MGIQKLLEIVKSTSHISKPNFISNQFKTRPVFR